MNGYPKNNLRISSLFANGGIMFFRIERPERIYKGTVLLSPVKDSCQRRVVHIREYGYRQESGKEEVK